MDVENDLIYLVNGFPENVKLQLNHIREVFKFLELKELKKIRLLNRYIKAKAFENHCTLMENNVLDILKNCPFRGKLPMYTYHDNFSGTMP